MHVVVIGAGIAGLSTAWALSTRGHKVTVLDRGSIPNPMASSHDEQRYHRFAYGKMAGYSKLALEAPAAWDMMWSALNERFYIETGVLYLTEQDDEDMPLSISFAQRNDLGVEQIGSDDFERRFPHFRLAPGNRAVLFPQSGILLAERILMALVRWLKETGATLHSYARVEEVDHESSRVRALGGWISSDAVIIAAGPWTLELAPEAQMLVPSRQVLLYANTPSHLAEAWADSPALADLTVVGNFYATPPLRGTQIKFTVDLPFPGNDPNASREASAQEIATVTAIAKRSLGSLETYQIVGGRACYYTNTPDRSFFVRSIGRSWVVSTCSGHGFKFGALTGIAMADAVESKLTEAEIRGKLEARS